MKSRYTHIKNKLHEIIFEADTFGGKLFDVILFWLIGASVVAVMLETVKPFGTQYGRFLYSLEWIFTIIFTIEYALRVWIVRNTRKYVFSFYGLIDLLAIIPTYMGLFLAGAQSLMVIRVMRLFRIFRVFKLAQFISEGELLFQALRASRSKIILFIYFVVLSICVFGSLLYVLEHTNNEGFDSIPRSIYWAIVTLTTVGYGDIYPSSTAGQFIAAVVMIMGYAVIAVPTGIVTSEIIATQKKQDQLTTQVCPYCAGEGHDGDAHYCKYCGKSLSLPSKEE